jgi:hypothetical protein
MGLAEAPILPLTTIMMRVIKIAFPHLSKKTEPDSSPQQWTSKTCNKTTNLRVSVSQKVKKRKTLIKWRMTQVKSSLWVKVIQEILSFNLHFKISLRIQIYIRTITLRQELTSSVQYIALLIDFTLLTKLTQHFPEITKRMEIHPNVKEEDKNYYQISSDKVSRHQRKYRVRIKKHCHYRVDKNSWMQVLIH